MLCSPCRKHETSTRNKSEIWVSKPCKLLRRDKVVQHSKSEWHQTTLERERLAAEASTVGGISQGFEQVISLQWKAVLGALKIVYWLTKHEVAHFTNFESLKELCIDLGCDYLKELNKGN